MDRNYCLIVFTVYMSYSDTQKVANVVYMSKIDAKKKGYITLQGPVHKYLCKFYVDISILALHLISTLLLHFLRGRGYIFSPIRLTLMSVYQHIFAYFPESQQLLEYYNCQKPYSLINRTDYLPLNCIYSIYLVSYVENQI